jgi:uncharacterized SAM-binding protein YcdF (DUF218 family)
MMYNRSIILKYFRKKYTKRTLLLLVLSTIVTAAILLLRNAGVYLLVNDPLPKKLDLIFTFAGENARNHYSEELLKQYPDAHWLLSDYKNGYVRILRRESFDMSRVTIVDTCKNTFSEVLALKEYLRLPGENALRDRQKPLQIGLISGPYHMRRIQLMTKKAITSDSLDIYYLPVPFDKYNWTSDMFKVWWKSPVYEVVSSETLKIVYFKLFK